MIREIFYIKERDTSYKNLKYPTNYRSCWYFTASLDRMFRRIDLLKKTTDVRTKEDVHLFRRQKRSFCSFFFFLTRACTIIWKRKTVIKTSKINEKWNLLPLKPRNRVKIRYLFAERTSPVMLSLLRLSRNDPSFFLSSSSFSFSSFSRLRERSEISSNVTTVQSRGDPATISSPLLTFQWKIT